MLRTKQLSRLHTIKLKKITQTQASARQTQQGTKIKQPGEQTPVWTHTSKYRLLIFRILTKAKIWKLFPWPEQFTYTGQNSWIAYLFAEQEHRFFFLLFQFNTLDWTALEQSDLNLKLVLPRARCWTRCSPAVCSSPSPSLALSTMALEHILHWWSARLRVQCYKPRKCL